MLTWRAHTPYDDIQARRHGVDGAPAEPQVQVNTFTGVNGGGRSQPVAAALAGGGYAIAWRSQFQDPGRSVDIYLQRFGEDGAPLGMETRVSSDTSATALGPAILGLAGGGIVVTWSFSGPECEFVVVQRFAADGSRLGEETRVDPPAPTEPAPDCFDPVPRPCRVQQTQAAAAALEDGGFVIAWRTRYNPADG